MSVYLWIVLPEVGGAQPAAAVLVVIQDLLARRRATNACENRRCIELFKRSNLRSLEGMHVQPHTGIGHVPSALAGIRSAHARAARARWVHEAAVCTTAARGVPRCVSPSRWKTLPVNCFFSARGRACCLECSDC